MSDYVEDLAATMLASTLGIEFNPDAAWDERKRVYELSDLIVDSLSITASAEGAANGDWTCAVSAAVFRFALPPRRAMTARLVHGRAWVYRLPSESMGEQITYGRLPMPNRSG